MIQGFLKCLDWNMDSWTYSDKGKVWYWLKMGKSWDSKNNSSSNSYFKKYIKTIKP